jgi:hypothetical protein
MGLIDRLRSVFTPVPVERDLPYFTMGGHAYPIPYLNQTLQGQKEEITRSFDGYVGGAYQGNGVVFACLNARMSLFKQASWMWQKVRSGTPGELWSSPELDILRTPWPNGTTGDLMARMIQDADLAGNNILLRRPGRIVRLRPDWAVAIHGSPNDANVGMWDPEAELLGYAYQVGGPSGGNNWRTYLPPEIAHFAPIPDPLAPARGMSWLTPLLREIEADSAATSHKLMYFRNGATPNLVVTGVPGATPAAFEEWVAKFGKGHDNARGQAYKTMYLSGTVDAKVVGNDLAQVDFKVTQGAGETRIAAAAGVPPIVVGLSEGLQGSSLNAGNFQAAMRRFADLTGRSLWQDAAGALSSILTVPGGSEGANRLWYDDRYIPALKDDVKDAAEVQSLQAQAMRQLIDSGWEPESVRDATVAGDWKRLQHSGLYSVQLQPPQPDGPPEPAAPVVPDAADVAQAKADAQAGRDMVLMALAEMRTMNEHREPAAGPVVNVTTPEVRADIHLTLPELAPVVNVTNDVAPTPVEVRNEVNVEPTPVSITNEAADVTVNVEPTPVSITNEVRAEAPSVTVTTPDTIRIASMPARRTVRVVTDRTPDGIARVDDLETDA